MYIRQPSLFVVSLIAICILVMMMLGGSWFISQALFLSYKLSHANPAILSVSFNQTKKPRLAVLISGRLLRFVFASIAPRVIAPNVAAGVHVDVFVQLVEGGFECPRKDKDKQLFNLMQHRKWSVSDLENTLRNAIERVGGRLEHFRVDTQPYIHPQMNPKAGIVHKISDPTYGLIQRCAESQAAFMKFRGWQAVMKHELRNSFVYDFILNFREDNIWIANMQPLQSFAVDKVSVKVRKPS
mmetsp:Transcript_31552/g.77330  ORF Transcript_31552/g.77330 Transcript_31552/m.77330 type:complete len:241 (-) Transcript_31552:1412-2134(-)